MSNARKIVVKNAIKKVVFINVTLCNPLGTHPDPQSEK